MYLHTMREEKFILQHKYILNLHVFSKNPHVARRKTTGTCPIVKDLKSKLMHSLIHVNPFSDMQCTWHLKNSNITKNCAHNKKFTFNPICCTHVNNDVMDTNGSLMGIFIFINVESRLAKLAIWTKRVLEEGEDLLVVLSAILFKSCKREQLGLKIKNKKPQVQGF